MPNNSTATSSDTPKEDVYDTEIAPLMKQIIAICTRAGICVHAGFALDEDQACTTHVAPVRADVPEEDREGYDQWRATYELIARRATSGHVPMLAITTRSGDGAVKSIEVIHGV